MFIYPASAAKHNKRMCVTWMWGVSYLLDGWLFCQKMMAIYHILPVLFLSTLARKLCHWS